ncbi:DNA-binding transcriptional activator GcvA [Wenxinia marina]|nr:LysR substrate-binding domain-containing protein [Wenxinia marina]GGL54916.1 DNA-binding transcriptional activator GcvA [Wenxinia marina]
MTDPDWRHLPPLSALRAFEAAARLGSFAAAARALSVTPPAVAQQVRGLESGLGVPLFRKAGRGQALTEAGERLSRALSEGFATIAAGVEDLRQGERRRGLRISTTPAFAQISLLPRLSRFWARHPDIAVSLVPDARPVELEREGFDLAVRTGPGDWPGVKAIPLLRSRMLVVAAPTLAARGLALGESPWLFDAGNGMERGWLRGAGLDPDRLQIRGLDDAGLTAARSGYGLCFASEEVAGPDLAAGTLVEVPFPGLPVFRYWVVLPDGPRRPAVDTFVRWLTAEFARD